MPETPAMPELSAEHKLGLRNFQYEILQLQARIKQLNEDGQLFLAKVLKELGVDANKYTLHNDSLALLPKEEVV